MAVVARRIGTWEDASIILEADYDTILNFIITIRCINNSSMAVLVEAVQRSNGRSRSIVFPAETTTEINIPTGVGTRLVQLWEPTRQKFYGVGFSVLVPAP